MRIFICLLSLVFSITTAAETDSTTHKAPVLEPATQNFDGRLHRIEKILDSRALLNMLELIESLKTDVNFLRGEIELQAHNIDQLKQKQRELYTDIDRRLQRLEANNAIAESTVAEQVLETMADQQANGIAASGDEPGLDVVTTPDLPTNIPTNTEAGAKQKTTDPQTATMVYQRAFKLLKESQYSQAQKAFKGFLNDYPDDVLADNAQYWLGETSYVMQQYDIAINEYQALLNTFPDSKKASQALLKMGYSYAELDNATEARKILLEVIKQYPGTTAARLADERLQKLNAAQESNT